MELSPEALVTLPNTLMEVAKVYESYGAFEGALVLLSMILENFPTYPDLFDTLFRSVVIMRHLATFPGAPSDDLLQRCEEFLTKLMEKESSE